MSREARREAIARLTARLASDATSAAGISEVFDASSRETLKQVGVHDGDPFVMSALLSSLAWERVHR